MKTYSKRKAGFTLVEIMIVVAIIGLLAAIAIPNFVRARNTSQQNTCINNLRQIDAAVKQWAMENKKSDTDTATSDDVAKYIKNNKFPTCPSGGDYIGFPGAGGVDCFHPVGDPICDFADLHQSPYIHELPNTVFNLNP